jgi:precorrin-3B synthase
MTVMQRELTPAPNPSPQGGGEQIRRRGACPGLSAPLATGDGLLVRFSPLGTISLVAFGALCEAANRHGNGVVEITARGNIQVRGLSAATAPDFAAAVAALDIAAADGVPIVCNPLAGFDPHETVDASKLAAKLRGALAQSAMAARLSPKVSVVIDGGGACRLDALATDIRARAFKNGNGRYIEIEVAGHTLGSIALGDAVAALVRLLGVVADQGRQARARDVVAAESLEVFRAAIAKFLISSTLREIRNEQSAIGAWQLRDGSFACGIALPFGHADAALLQQMIGAAGASGAHGFRTAPDRTLLAIGLPREKLESFVSAAGSLGFIVEAGDPRRNVVACAGAPICSAAHIAARALGPRIAAAAAPYLDSKFKIHVSGCAKGCAHPSPAALTVVGTDAGCALVANGSARDTPFMTASTTELVGRIADVARKLRSEAPHV